MTLALGDPLEIDTGAFEFTLTLEEPNTGPPKCLLVSVGGFHLAFLGAAIPGAQASRWAVGGGELSVFVESLTKGKGLADEDLLKRGEQHEITFRGYRSSGRPGPRSRRTRRGPRRNRVGGS